MIDTDDRRNPALPPPPAPTRRGANPWHYSETGRRQEPLPPGDELGAADSLVPELRIRAGTAMRDAPVTHGEVPQPHRSKPSAGPGLLPLAVLGFVVVVVLRVLMKARGASDWAGLVVPLFIVFAVAHSWWKRRRRRNELSSTKTG